MIDPLFYVYYSDSLMSVGKLDQAREVIYTLIANEAYYTAEELSDGSPVIRDG